MKKRTLEIIAVNSFVAGLIIAIGGLIFIAFSTNTIFGIVVTGLVMMFVSVLLMDFLSHE